MASPTSSFDRLATNVVNGQGLAHADALYRGWWPGCDMWRPPSGHVLDRILGIDTLVRLPVGGFLTVQEKFRKNELLVSPRLRVDPSCPDFTQEHKNAAGTDQESKGEWFKLAAQLYFYSWLTEAGDGLAAWMLMDVARYRNLVVAAGGLQGIGRLQNNKEHGRASFYCIPVRRLSRAIVAASRGLLDNPSPAAPEFLIPDSVPAEGFFDYLSENDGWLPEELRGEARW